MATTYEDSFWKTISEFLPGIVKFFSGIAIIGLIFNFFSLSVAQSEVVLDSGNFDVSIQRSYNHTVGSDSKGVKLLYFVDYQCPACRGNAPVMTEVKSTYSDKVQFIYKHFPLDSIHIYAKTLARGVQAAEQQGKYEELADAFFALQESNKYSASSLEETARNVGLDVDKWNQDRNSDIIAKQVENDKEDLENVELSENSAGVSKPAGSLVTSDNSSLGTPMSVLFKDGKVIDWWSGGLPKDTLTAKLDSALNN